jgi:hypothetical protein
VRRLGLTLLALAGGLYQEGTIASGGLAAEIVFFHHGTCDASAAVALTDRAFVVANDEDSRLRLYFKDESSPAVWTLDWAPFLEPDPAHPEADIEGAARVGEVIYWITSHARNQEGKHRESRHRFFATRIEGTGTQVRLAPVGRAYRGLVDDLANDAALRDLDLAEARRLAPKTEGALNIEGLAAGDGGTLWIGFRNPVPGGKAVLVRLLNPAEVIEGQIARFGEVVRLDLGKRGIRDLVWTGDDYVIVAGTFDGGGKSRVYRWPGPGGEPRRVRETDLADFNAEAVIHFAGDGRGEILLLSDDSGRELDGIPCRDLEVPAQRSFRSIRLR